jgi:hypothetical protein
MKDTSTLRLCRLLMRRCARVVLCTGTFDVVLVALWASSRPAGSGSAPIEGVGRDPYEYTTHSKAGTGKVC